MEFLEWAEARTSRLSVTDIALVKWSCIACGVLLARKVPALQKIDTKVLGAVVLGLAAKPAVSVLSSGSR